MDSRPVALYYAILADLMPHLQGAPDGVLSPYSVGDVAPWPDISIAGFRSLALLKSFLKKFEELDDKEKEGADAAALKKFLDANAKCAEWSMPAEMWTWEEVAMNEMKNFVHYFFNPRGLPLIDYDSVLAGLATGPGASVGASGESFYHKVAAGSLTSTSMALYNRYLGYVDRYPLWRDAEVQRILSFGAAVIVQGSKLGFAPKSFSCSRTICTEPSLNMMFQKGIDSVLRDRLKTYWGIDLQTQAEKNSELARLGSMVASIEDPAQRQAYLAHAGTFADCEGLATIDLTSASDTISRPFLKWLLPREVYNWLNICRSPVTELPDGKIVDLHMISSMGNGYTFSLETIIFTAAVLAIYKSLGIEAHEPRGTVGNFGVFGDDIVVDRRAYEPLCRLLETCGFMVNSEKSYAEGTFRESCGKDWLSGHTARGVYCKHLKRAADRYSLLNRLVRWSASTGLPLPSSCQYLLKGLNKTFVVPLVEADDAGIKIPRSLLDSLKVRPFVAVKDGSKLSGMGYTSAYKKLRPRSPSIPVSTYLDQLVAILGGLSWNPPGFLLAAVAGHLKGGSIGVRTMHTGGSQVVTAICPGWDYVDHVLPENGTRVYSTYSKRPDDYPTVPELEASVRTNLTSLFAN